MIFIEIDGPIARIRLGRKETRNALDTENWLELRRAVESVSATAARVIIIESAFAGAFCAGSNIKVMSAIHKDPVAVERFRLEMRNAIDALAGLAVPTVANVQGDCFGAGVALMLACDVSIAGNSARFAVPPAKLGLTYPAEDIARLVQRIGASQAKRLLMSAETISATTARDIGLVELEGDDDYVTKYACGVAANAPASVMMMKKVVDSVSGDGASAIDDEFNLFFERDALAEGLCAFREKRQPIFRDA